MWNSSTEALIGYMLLGLCLIGWLNLIFRLWDFVTIYYVVLSGKEQNDYDAAVLRESAERLRWHLMGWVICVFFMTWVIRNFL